MTAKLHTTYQLRQMASIDISAIAQTCKLLSERDAATYLDCITIGVHALRKGPAPLIETADNNGTAVYVVTDGKTYFSDEGAFTTGWVKERERARRFVTQELAERAAKRLGRACRVEIVEIIEDTTEKK